MSLINEALKKAQRQRLDEEAGPDNIPGAAGGGVARRGKPNGTNTVVLLGAGGLVLIVLSVVLTVYLVNRPGDAKHVATATVATPTPKPTAASATTAPGETSPAIVVPKITPAAAAPATSPLTSPTSSAPATNTVASASNGDAASSTQQPSTSTTITAPPPVATTSSAPPSTTAPLPAAATVPAAALPLPPLTSTPPAASTPAPQNGSAAAASLPPGAPDERVAAFVDAIRVTGIRSSGADSRVLMNERVYRVNDIVERNLGVRLIKAATDSLTFSDPRGVTYVKNF